ncbi:acyl carrier protein [Candidatus Woesearchaeota archaeon]|nr:acyl carrier protein [Candidatus Woesearchaeota archaeon]
METLREIVARVLGIEKQKLNDASSPENMSSWDSFNALMLVSELEKNFSIKFTMDQVMSVKNYKDIKDILKKLGATKGIDD